MLTPKVIRSLRMMLVVLGLGMMLTLSGCSSWHRRKAQEVAGPQVTPPAPVAQAPESAPQDRPTVGSTVEFPAESGVADVRFDYDKSNIRRDQVTILDKNLAFFKANPDVKIMIEGHCDERGTTEYNFALGQRRAAAVQEYLIKNGIAAERLATISKGKDQPQDPARTEAAYAKNRRAHFMRMY